jgi:TonB-dependent SusC/RagA subfamily outer membrane receptor
MLHEFPCRRTVLLAAAFVLFGCGKAALPEEDATPRPGDPNVATADQWSGQNAASTEELLAGRFPGVQVYRVPGGIAVRIRGGTSLHGNDQPLYVVDGMTIEPGPGGALTGLNPADIEKIEVLKDIGSTSMYGGRGANGVIVIKTRRGR